MGKFRQIFTELSASDTLMVGYYSLMFINNVAVILAITEIKLSLSLIVPSANC